MGENSEMQDASAAEAMTKRPLRVLLAVDGSPSSAEARDLVASLAWPSGTTVTLLAAYTLPSLWFGEGMAAGEWLAEAEDELRDGAQAELETMAGPIEARGWNVERRAVMGRPASVIAATADEIDADLIVLGSRGRGTIGSMLLGSVSAEVAAEARQSVLVARGSGVTRLLVATDGSDCASVIPSILASWHAFQGLPTVALSIAPVDSPAMEFLTNLYTMGSEPVEERRATLVEGYADYAATMARRLTEAGLPAEHEGRSGDAAHGIIEAARDHRADLIVTGSRCLHGVDRLLLGSVARNVLLHAHASVLIVRPRRPRRDH